MNNEIDLLTGFGNDFQSEAIAGTLPIGQNAPQKVAHELYAEQLSGSAFTAPRHRNLRSWLYKIQPSVVQGEFSQLAHPSFAPVAYHDIDTPPTALRWHAMPYPNNPEDFIDSLFTVCGNGSAETNVGGCIHLYACNKSMDNRYFYDADGDLLIVPQEGALTIKTEFGILRVGPGHIALLPRGIKCQINLDDDKARGYVLENFGAPFIIPDLGPIGANGLANPRDFIAPQAWYEDCEGDFELVAKFHNNLWHAPLKRSPLNAVAWHGNYVPYQYDLARFNTMGTVSFDHPDPSIFTVLTSPSAVPGTANFDFVIFPPRWMVAQNTFRPPYYHRNIMSEFMGLITGVYDAKNNGFEPGGASIHNAFTGHGPDADAYQAGIANDLKPEQYQNTLAFMFESRHILRTTPQAMTADFRDNHYTQCWQSLKASFSDRKK